MSPKGAKCPTCRREIDWASSPYRPFCSERCRLIDLGAWLSEKHAIPGDAASIDGNGADSERPPKDAL